MDKIEEETEKIDNIDEDIVELTMEEQEKLNRKNLVLMCKLICLNKMGYSLLTNIRDLKTSERRKIVLDVDDLINNSKLDYITSEFNMIVNENLFNDKVDITNYPIYTN